KYVPAPINPGCGRMAIGVGRWIFGQGIILECRRGRCCSEWNIRLRTRQVLIRCSMKDQANRSNSYLVATKQWNGKDGSERICVDNHCGILAMFISYVQSDCK